MNFCWIGEILWVWSDNVWEIIDCEHFFLNDKDVNDLEGEFDWLKGLAFGDGLDAVSNHFLRAIIEIDKDSDKGKPSLIVTVFRRKFYNFHKVIFLTLVAIVLHVLAILNTNWLYCFDSDEFVEKKLSQCDDSRVWSLVGEGY